MKKTIIAKHNSNHQVLLCLQSNENKFSEIPILKSFVSELDKLVTDTDELITKSGGIPSKTGGNKNIARTELVAIAFILSNILKVFATITKNENLNNFIVKSKSALEYEMRHQELLDYAKNLMDRLTPLTTELANYGLLEEHILELDSEIQEFEQLMTEPRQLISERKTINELIEEKIDAIYGLLNNQIDPLLELFSEDLEFYLAYKTARMIVDPASRKRTLEIEINAANEE